MSKFAEKLRDLRKSNELTQEQLATALKTATSTISMYEMGRREPDIEMLETIADYFNVNMSTLLDREENQDEEIMELRERLRRQPGLRMLFDVSKNVKEKDIMKFVRMIEAFKDEP